MILFLGLIRDIAHDYCTNTLAYFIICLRLILLETDNLIIIETISNYLYFKSQYVI